MNIPYKLAPAIALALGVSAPSVYAAALPEGALLQINDGVPNLDAYGVQTNVSSGSWFGMDTDGNSKMSGTEKTAMRRGPDGGIIIGTTQSASGSHTGAPNGTENTSIDLGWNFFGNTGMHFTATTAPVAIGGDTVNGITLSGWRVTWNGIAAINMGTDAWNPANCVALNITTCSFSNGVAQIEWDGTNGGSFRLIYTATVPAGDPSGFGGVQYLLNLEGTVIIPGAVSALTGTLMDGDAGGTAANNYRTTSLPADTGYNNVGGFYDYKVDCGLAGCTDSVFIPLTSAIPSGAVLRKYGVTPGNPAGGWADFDTTGGDTIESADSTSGGGDCTAATYSAGLTAGHDCLRITQTEGGLNDTDTTANDGIFGDPSAIAVPASTGGTAADLSSGSSGCTLADRPASIAKAGDWMLLGLALAGLAWLRRRMV